MDWLKVLARFSRPHTIVGTSLSVLGLYVIALAHGKAQAAVSPAGVILTLVSCLAANVYIVGLNQLTDVAIDRINKPDLPLAAGTLSMRAGKGLVMGSALLSLLLAAVLGRILLATVTTSMLIGTAYSLPPLRLKRFHFWAAACIFSVRGVVVNLLLFLHFSRMLGGAMAIPPQVWVLTAFVLGFSLAIAWFKDIPDSQGDRRFRIGTLAVRLGSQRVFALGLGVLALCYGGMALAGLVGVPGVNGGMLAASHLALLGVLAWRSRGTRPGNPSSMTRFYMFVWGLFFAEYLVFPLAVLLA